MPPTRPGKPSAAAGLWRSDDAGATWTRANATPGLGSSYMNRVTADPRNRDAVYVTGQSIRRSEDAGKTLTFFRGAPGGDDYHFLWINPKNPEYMVTAADQGTIVTVNGGKSWSDWYNQPTGQFYHVETDNRFPYRIYSGQQDSGTVGAASRSDDGVLTYRDWRPVGGEERGWDVPDPRDPDIVYGTGLGGTITRFDARTSQVRHVSPAAESTYGRRPVAGAYRWAWVFPLAISPKPPHALYAGSQYLLRSLDEGASWEKASPDLSGAVAGTKGCEGDVTLAAARPCGFGTIFTIELSPRDPDEIWIGTDDGLVQRTLDGGKSWKNVTPKGLPAWSKISTLDVSPLEPGVVYAAVDAHRLDDFTPHAYRTRDGGESWQEITAGLPPSGFVMAVRADTVRRGLLYAGTDTGVFVSFDDGNRWQPLQANLPVAWVSDIKVHGSDLVISTQGRGLWVLDDVTPLRQLTPEASSTAATLVAPAETIRVRANQYRDTPLPPEVPFAHNPPPGAVIDYALGIAGEDGAPPDPRRAGSDRARVLEQRSAGDAERAPLLHGSLSAPARAALGGPRASPFRLGPALSEAEVREVRIHDLGGGGREHARRSAGAAGASRPLHGAADRRRRGPRATARPEDGSPGEGRDGGARGAARPAAEAGRGHGGIVRGDGEDRRASPHPPRPSGR